MDSFFKKLVKPTQKVQQFKSVVNCGTFQATFEKKYVSS